MAITLDQAKSLTRGDVLHGTARPCDSRNGPIRWRVNGEVQTWKRDPLRVRVPIKWGLKLGWAVTEDNLFAFSHFESECPVMRAEAARRAQETHGW